MCKEYRDSLTRIDQDVNIPDDNKEKLILVVGCIFLGVLATTAHDETFPLDIYESDDFSDDYKGNVAKPGQENVSSQNLGLLKNYMPLPADDTAFTDKAFPYLKPSDRSTYTSTSGWAHEIANTGIQVFVNSISGTMLAQLRAMKELANTGKLISFKPGELQNYLKCLTSTLLYISGGHTFHEFLAPLQLSAVQHAFNFIPGFNLLTDTILLLDTNNKPFDIAIDETIKYNNMLLKRAAVHQEVREKATSVKLKPIPVKPKPSSASSTQFYTAANKDGKEENNVAASNPKKPTV